MLLADRFLRDGDAWFDLATGDRVHVITAAAGPRRDQVDWAERCAMLALLRHPLLNPLIDYGVADRTTLFEAYGVRAPLAASRGMLARLVAHVRRFLAAHGVPLTASLAARALRPLRPSASSARTRPVGIILQPRRALAMVHELLTEEAARGTSEVRITGPPGGGLRTLRLRLAHLARVGGYVPLCPSAAARWPALVPQIAGRHLCLFTGSDPTGPDGRVLAWLLAVVAERSARSHVCLRFGVVRGPDSPADISLDRMGPTTMVRMVYRDGAGGPSLEEIVAAARRADGWPGGFLAALGARMPEPSAGPVLAVHESPAAYGAGAGVARHARPAPPGGSRMAAVLARAGTRAAVLERRGRHGAAARLLARAARVLEGRGSGEQAARCWLQLAWLVRTRGATGRACEHADRARRADAAGAARISAGHLTAVCWTDEGRLLEAEASLRTLVVAADALPDDRLAARCRLSLGRVLCWDGKAHDALHLVQPLRTRADGGVACEALTLCSRAHLLAAELPAAVTAAADAVRRAAALHEARLQASAHRAMAEALLAAGDVDGVRAQVGAGMQAARDARLPLANLRLRAILLRALLDRDRHEREAVRLRAALERALRGDLPVLVRRRLEDACRVRQAAYTGPRPAATDPAANLETFLETAQRAADDRSAVADVLALTCERLGAASAVLAARDGRLLVTAGRPWRERSVAVAQALAGGAPAVAEGRHPLECAEPVRCGGELLGALGCRWTLGSSPLPGLRAATLRAASLAIATHVRVLIDSTAPDPPPAVWGDLLGESAVAAALRESVHRASRAPFNVLIEGESGVGKELVARAIHKLSSRHTRRFCAINCAALSDELVEAELFGHARGAFTGAMTERAGLFEEADGGTLFLDEVGELSPRAQAKLLRALQEGEVRRVGENLPRRVDVRVIAATNRRLEQEAASGRFRTDLRFRLDVLRICVPPLRERVADIPVLAQHFWTQAAARVGCRATLGPDTLAALSRYDWPGNVRELQNAIAWIAVHAPRRGRVGASLLPAQLASTPLATGSFEAAREEFERRFVRAALAQAGGQRQKAARALGVSRQGLTKMLRRLGIEHNGST